MGKITTVSFTILLSFSFFFLFRACFHCFFFSSWTFYFLWTECWRLSRFPWHETIGGNTYLTDWVTCHLSILSTPPYQVFFEVYLTRFRSHLCSWMDRGRVREHQTLLGLEPFLLKLAFSIIFFCVVWWGSLNFFFIFSFLISIFSKRRVNGRTPLISYVVDSILLAGEIRWWNQRSRIKGKPPQGKFYVLYLRQYFTSPYNRFKIAQESTAWHWTALKSNP